MPFLNLSLTNFRNLQNETMDTFAKEVFFVGQNGQGKSNLLEALYYVSYASSFRTRSESEIVRYNEKEFSVRTMFKDANERTNIVGVFYQDAKKRIERNGKQVKDRKELVNTIPCVLFCHSDMDFVAGEPERRRFFIDQSLTMHDAFYVDLMRRYKKLLKSRNTLLKEHNYGLLDVLDQQLAETGLEIQKKRKEVIHYFNVYFADFYSEITGIDNVKIVYSPSWKVETAVEVQELLLQKRDSDKVLETTMSGPHRDQIRFVQNGKAFVPGASTGQRRMLSILLRIMQALYYCAHTQKKPVLLMDDVLLELDPVKRHKVMNLLPEYDQLFCTFLPGEPYENYKKSGTKIFEIENGIWNVKSD